jgi:hypothetical protein
MRYFWVPLAFLIISLCCSFMSEVKPARHAGRCAAWRPLTPTAETLYIKWGVRPRTGVELVATTKIPASAGNRNRPCDWLAFTRHSRGYYHSECFSGFLHRVPNSPRVDARRRTSWGSGGSFSFKQERNEPMYQHSSGVSWRTVLHTFSCKKLQSANIGQASSVRGTPGHRHTLCRIPRTADFYDVSITKNIATSGKCTVTLCYVMDRLGGRLLYKELWQKRKREKILSVNFAPNWEGTDRHYST